MKQFAIFTAIALLVLSCKTATNSAHSGDPEIESLIKKMSVDEKVGQMTQITLDVITEGSSVFESDEPLVLHKDSLQSALVEYHIGSVLNTANNRARSIQKWEEVVNQIQSVATNDTRLKIPVIYGIDAIHGATYTAGATMFPQQIAQAATWNRDLVFQAAKVTAYEVRTSSIPWNFSPVLDLGIDPRWPRHWETFGEDPYLVSEMGVQVIKGYQGDNVYGNSQVAACLKHFLAYSAASSGKDRTPAQLSENALREYHLRPFQKAIEAGAATIMINSGLINGIPVHSNYNILTKLLKQELKFEGVAVTDWADIENLHLRDKVASSHKKAIKMAINAGIDMSMVPYNYRQFCDNLIDLINEGEIPMTRIDDAVRRILTLKKKLGLFELGSTSVSDYPKFGSKDFEKMSFDAASEAITLLKNEAKTLPIKSGAKILVAGPNANSMRTLNGGWTYSWQGEKVEEFAQNYNTFYEAIANKFGTKNVWHVAGVEYNMEGSYFEEHNINIQEAVNAAKKVDVVVLCLGENSYTEKPGDLHDMMISENQIRLAKELASTGKPIVLVLNEGRPRIIRTFIDDMDAILQTYLSGNFAGDALAAILSGDINPSGKLPYTYPMFSNSLVVYNHKPSEESTSPEGMYDYGGGFYPQFEFGFGLSYTSFEFSKLKVDKESFGANEEITIQVNVKNTGDRTGKEVVQLYSSDLYASLTPDVKRLRRFTKLELLPGQEEVVQFKLRAEDLAFVNENNQTIAEAGDFMLMIQELKQKVSLNETKTY